MKAITCPGVVDAQGLEHHEWQVECLCPVRGVLREKEWRVRRAATIQYRT